MIVTITGRRHGVIATSTPGVTTQDALEGEPTSGDRPMPPNRFHCISRASRLKAAHWRQQGRDQPSVELDRGQQQDLDNIHK
jgi:hypothetical protein